LGNGSDGAGAHQCGFTGWYNADDYLHVTLQHAPVQVRGVTNAVAIARGVGNMHNCVVRNNGTVSCWGWISDADQSWSTVPVTVKNLNNVVSAAIGSDHSCALLADQTVKCWGDNVDGAIGNGDPCSSGSCSGVPATTVLVAAGTPLDQVRSIFSGAFHTCALKNDGSVWCWGYNAKGQLGNGTTVAGRYAIRSNFPSALDVMTGSQFTCVRATDNALWCAGYNEYGGFGSDPPTPDPVAPNPTPIKSLTFASPLVALAAGTYNACAIVSSVQSSSNVVQCWGDNWTGQLGNGSVDSSLSPVSATGMNNVTEIAAGSTHTCAVRAGAVYCWGNNDAGQIGTATAGPILDPTKVEGLQL
jgi:alpha-tubulin suppressor-like RCC1 family protein